MNSPVTPTSLCRRSRRRCAPLALLAVTVLASVLAVSACGGGDNAATGPTPTPPPVGPTITAVSPASGATLGGTQITITGTNFVEGAAVTVGGVAATGVRVSAANSMSAVTGPHASGPSDVVVTVSGRSATLSGGFVYVAVPPNSKPVITAVTVQGTRPNQPANFADINEEVVVKATVTDAETPVTQLTFDWSADIGTITSTSGATARWRAPASITVPVIATITLRVTEVVATVAGPTAITQTAVATATASVHNSIREIAEMSRQFLVDFSNSALSPEYVVRDFWDGCPGKADELDDVRQNRASWLITSYQIGEPTSVSVNFSSACVTPNRPARAGDGCSVVPCQWHDLYKPTGQTGTTVGLDYLSAVYRSNRWWLCSSDFPQGTITTPVSYPAFIR